MIYELILTAAFLSQNASAAGRKLTMDEVSKHATAADCWIVIKNKVYDISAYVTKHPARLETITKYCGTRADRGWETKDKDRAHSRSATRLLDRYEIGEMIE